MSISPEPRYFREAMEAAASGERKSRRNHNIAAFEAFFSTIAFGAGTIGGVIEKEWVPFIIGSAVASILLFDAERRTGLLRSIVQDSDQSKS